MQDELDHPIPAPPLASVPPSSMHRSDSARSMPVSRRNSFSRNTSFTIDQFRSAVCGAKVESAERPSLASSPRKAASFPQLIPSNPSSPVRHETPPQDFASRISIQRAMPVQARFDAPAVAVASNSSDSESGDDEDVREVDLSVDSISYSDLESDSASAPSSPVATSEFVGADLNEPGTVDTSKIKTRARSFLDELPDWLNDPPAPSAASSRGSMTVSTLSHHTVQQIEDDIQGALDAAASRVKHEAEWRERFQQELSDAASRPVSIDVIGTSEAAVQPSEQVEHSLLQHTSQAPPELLLLMEVVIGEGRSETIEVHVGEVPHELARQFAVKHELKPESIPKLTTLIQDQLDALNLEDLGFPDDPAAAEATQQQEQQPVVQNGGVCHDSLEVTNARAHHQQHQHDAMLQHQQTQQQTQHDHRDGYHRGVDDAHHRAEAAAEDGAECDKHERRAMNYHNLMAKYGHYTQHSGKVDPNTVSASLASRGTATDANASADARLGMSDSYQRTKGGRDPLTLRNIQLAEYALPSRRHTLSVPSKHSKSMTSKTHKDKAPQVFDRLYALAESKEKWIRRAQNAKQRDLEKEQQQRKVEMAAKSRDLIAHRSSGGYAHIGERLYDEALSDMAKKDRLREQRAREREHEIDWMCPKCAFVNQFSDDVCKNVIAQLAPFDASVGASFEDTRARSRRESAVGMFLDSPEVICGQPKPEELFRPTLLASSASVVSAVNVNKERAVRIASIRRERSQQAMEDEFRQACPFKPKINEVSEEIVRERLENDVRAMGLTSSSGLSATTTTASGELRRKDPHLALYEDSFTVRANRQAREEEYLRQYTFKPDIGVNALWVSSGESREDFVERLAVSKYQELEKKRQALHDKYAPDRDPDSGREFFKPETGRAPVFSRNERGLPIGDFLHESHREQQEYHRRLQQRSVDEMNQKRKQGFVSESSRQALAARKKKTFARIFDALLQASTLPEDPADSTSAVPAPNECDIDTSATRDTSLGTTVSTAPPTVNRECAVVTPSRVQLARLPREIAAVVPIVFEFASHEPFTYSQFGGYMEKLMTEVPGFTYTQVLFLAEHLDDGKSSRVSSSAAKDKRRSSNLGESDDEELTFRPVIDKNSSVIAKKHGRADPSKVFNALNQYFEHYKSRKAQIRKQQQREFERLHPFQPQFVASKNRNHASAGFYDKIKQQEFQHAATVAASSGGLLRSQDGDTPLLQTALANVRPCVRPIEDVVEMPPAALGTRSSSGSSSQFIDELGLLAGSDDDADLTSRVLAALDELPPTSQSAMRPPPPPSPSISGSVAPK